ncbi:MAG TPA: hypothetical protein VH309_05885, partial [Elusimicrobiota bacterium]|nr:hypothetical protein [Elusimicrobiota bacterium]
MRLRASSFASIVLLAAGLALPASAAAQAGGTVTFGGGTPDAPAPPPPPPPPPGEAPAPGMGAAPPPAAAAPAAPAAEGEEDEATQAAEWAERDRDINESNTLNGGTGLLKTQHAQTGSPGQFRIGFTTEWFSAGFLCTTKYPCQNPNGGAPLTSDTMNHVGGTLSISATLAKLG